MAFLETIAKTRPDVASHLREAARLLREEGECHVPKPLGGPMMPAKSLVEPIARRKAGDVILEARYRNAKALHCLARALGRKHTPRFDGKELKDLRPALRWMTVMSGLEGCMRYVDREVDTSWLYGVTGVAFMLNIDENVDVSGPTSWGHERITEMAPYLGVTLAHSVSGRTEAPDFEGKLKAARAFITAKIDAGVPMFGFDGGYPEYFTVNGYNDDAALYWTHYTAGGYMPRPWSKVGRNDVRFFEFVSVEPTDRKGDDRAAVREALAFALEVGRSKPSPDGRNAKGIAGYEMWIRCLQSGDWRKPGLPGVHHNAACWNECRVYAEGFLRLAGKKLGGQLKPLFDKAADHYREVRLALGKMQAIFIYKYPLPPVNDDGVAQGVELLCLARDAEMRGLEVVGQILKRMRYPPLSSSSSSGPNSGT